MNFKSLQCVQRQLAGVDACSLSLEESIPVETYLALIIRRIKNNQILTRKGILLRFQISTLIKNFYYARMLASLF